MVEPTLSLSVYIFYCTLIKLIISFLFCLQKKIVVGKVIAAIAEGIFILYIEKIHFVVNRLGKGKE